MVDAAYRHDELVAHSPSERARLGKGQVVRIRGDAAAYKAGLPKYEPAMLLNHAGERFCPKHGR